MTLEACLVSQLASSNMFPLSIVVLMRTHLSFILIPKSMSQHMKFLANFVYGIDLCGVDTGQLVSLSRTKLSTVKQLSSAPVY